MRTLSRFLVLLLCLELIVSPIAPNISIAIKNANAESCPTGFTFDSTLNRCLTKTETANVMNATMNCDNDKECYKENAKKAFMEDGSAPENKKDGFVSKIAIGAATAGAVTYATMALMKKTSGCKSPAFYGMIGGALALVIGDNLANMQHAKRLKTIQEDWGKVINPEQANGDKDREREASIESQSEAFEMLARAEDSLAQAAKMKQKFFMVASLAFGVTAVISASEIIQNKSLKNLSVTAARTAVTSTAAAAASGVTPPDPAVANIGLVQKAAASTSIASGKKDALDAGEKETPADAAALKSAADQATMAKALQLKVSQKTASVEWDTAAKTMTGSKAQAAVEAAAKASKAWEQHTLLTTCEDSDKNTTPQKEGLEDAVDDPRDITPVDPNAPQWVLRSNGHQGLYSYYLNSRPANIKAELQFMYNLKNSQDMTSFVMNKWEMDGVLKSPLDDYNIYKDSLNATVKDKTVFQAFKDVSIAAIEFMNPISTAHAREQEQVQEVDGGAGSGGGAPSSRSSSNTSKPSGVNTEGAKTYKEVTSKGIDYTTLLAGLAAGGAMAFTGVGKKLLTSKGRLIFSGVLTALTLLMSKHAGSQAEASEKRAELLRKMKDEFKSASGAIYACKSEDRNDPAKPNCYCYTAENQRNPNRGSSQICQKLWAGVNTKINNLTAATSSRVCVNSNRQADPACSCKKSNTCMKVKLSGVGGLDMGSMSVLGNGLAPVNGILGGTIDGAALSPATLGAQIAKVAAINKALDKNPEIAKAKSGKDALNLQKALEKGGAGLGSSGLLGGSGSSNMPSNPGEAARMLEKEIKDATAPTAIPGNNDFIAAPTPVAEENLEFGMTDDQLAAQEGQIAEVMDKDLDYGGNDINQGSNSNIFEVLSNRYQRSGMRRLFDEKGETKPEAAASTDISQ